MVGEDVGTLGKDCRLKKFLKGSKRVGKDLGGLKFDWKELIAGLTSRGGGAGVDGTAWGGYDWRGGRPSNADTEKGVSTWLGTS